MRNPVHRQYKFCGSRRIVYNHGLTSGKLRPAPGKYIFERLVFIINRFCLPQRPLPAVERGIIDDGKKFFIKGKNFFVFIFVFLDILYRQTALFPVNLRNGKQSCAVYCCSDGCRRQRFFFTEGCNRCFLVVIGYKSNS